MSEMKEYKIGTGIFRDYDYMEFDQKFECAIINQFMCFIEEEFHHDRTMTLDEPEPKDIPRGEAVPWLKELLTECEEECRKKGIPRHIKYHAFRDRDYVKKLLDLYTRCCDAWPYISGNDQERFLTDETFTVSFMDGEFRKPDMEAEARFRKDLTKLLCDIIRYRNCLWT